VQAGILREVRRAQQLAVEPVGPAVQRADDVGRGLAAALQHHGLAVAADVGQQLHAAIRRAHEHAPLAFLRQGVVIADFGNRQLVREIPRAVLEDEFLFAAEQVLVEIGGNGKLRARALQSFKRNAQVRHDPQDLQKTNVNPHPVAPRVDLYESFGGR
jgi:antitoxin component of MazEF toxin-antitoxin module